MISPRKTGTELVTPGGVKNLTLRELEALARALLPVLFAFLHAGIAREKTVCTKRWPQIRVELGNGARQSHAHRARLSANTAAMRGHHNVHLLGHIREFQRLGGVMLPCKVREIIGDRTFVQREFAGTRAQKYARNRFLAATSTQKTTFARNGRA